MKTFFAIRRSLLLLACAVVPLAVATPTISFTPGAFPATGSPVALSTTPTGLNISVTAAPTSGATISSVSVSVNGTVIGTATGSSPFVVNWVPTSAGNFTITATVTDTSGNTAGSPNTATINANVTINAARAAFIVAPANNFSVPTDSQIFLRSTATMTDGTVASVQYILDPGTANTVIGTATQAPYNVAYTVTAAPGAHTLLARATATDGTTTFDSSTLNFTVSAAVGTGPTVTITSPSSGDAIVAGAAVTVAATATDSDGFIPSTSPGGVIFYADGDPIGTDLTAPYSVSWTPTVPKTVSLRAQATDDKGNIRLSAPVGVTVTATAPTVAITSPANNSTATVGTSLFLTASATAPSGSTVANVQFFENGVAIGAADTTAPYTVQWTPANVGTAVLTARVTDSVGNGVTSSPINVTVGAAAPTITLNAPSTAVVNTVTTLTATANPGTSASIVQVQFLSGTTVLGTDSSAPYSFDWTPTSTGNFTLSARVTDSNGATTTSSSVTVTVSASTPTISITSPTNGSTIPLGSSTTITAAPSASSGATVTRVDFLAGTTTIGTVLSAPFSISWTPTTTGVVALTAKVTDSTGATSTSVAVNVNVTGPTVAITSPASGTTVAAGSSVALTATASAASPAAVSKVEFFSGTTLLGQATLSGGAFVFNWTPTTTGSASITARVTDSNGATATSSAISLTVSASAPTISISSPTNGASIALGTPTNITANPTASNGATVSRVDFFAGNTTIGTALTAPYTVSWTPTATGVIALTARVTDTSSATATSSIVNVNVTSANISVALTAPTAGTTAGVGTPVTVTATASTVAPATITQVEFFAGNTSIGTATTAPYSVTYTPATTGAVSLTARATDSTGATATSSAVTLNVTAATPTASLLSPTQGATVTVGTATSLTATATPTAGNSITRVDYLVNGTSIGGSASGPFYPVNWTPAVAGVFTIVARATDSSGAIGNSTGVAVNAVAGTSSSFSVALAMTGSANIPGGSSRVLTATPTPNTGIDHIDLLLDGSVVATDNTSPYNFIFTAPTDSFSTGTHQLVARVVDATGATASSTPLTINIVNPIGQVPLIGINTPAANSFLGPNVATTISGTASDGDGTITSIQVLVNGTTTGLANAGLATISGSNWSITWTTPTTGGVYSITAIASDSSGNAVAAPPINVTIADASAPTLSLLLLPGTAGSPASATLPSGAVRNIVANATASSGRAIVRVEFFVDGTKVGEDTMFPFTYRYVAPPLDATEQSRTFVFSARATDNAGAARDAFVPLLVVQPVGLPPTVNLLTPANNATVFPNTDVSMAATAVPAAGASIASVQFFVNGNVAGITTTNPVTAAPYVATFRPTAPGIYTIDAIATDDRGNTTISNSVTIAAAFATPTIVFTSPNPNATARATPGVPLTLAATATVQTGTGASILLVEFLLDGVQIGADTTAPYTFSWIPTPAQLGQHVLTARVTDTNSQTATTNPITVNVANVIGSPPTVSVVAQPIPAGFGLQTASTVNFVATAVATGTGSILANVEIFLNDISIGLAAREQNTNFYRIAYDLNRFDFTSVTPVINDTTGAVTYPVRLYAIARDSNNNQTVSATTNLVINPATSQPPSLQLVPLTPTNITAGTQFFIGAAVNDIDGVVTQIQLYANGVQVGAIANPQQGAVLTYNANNAGRFNLYAVATDDTGNTMVSSPAIVVNVTAVNAPTTTITRPVDDSSTASVGSPVFLEGTAVNTSTTQIPTLQFVATAASGSRQIINGQRVGNTTTYRAIWTPINPDTYTVTTQSSVGVVQGTSTASRRVVVTEIVGLAPTIALTRGSGVSGVPSSATTASTADFAATATDPDGSVVDVEFFLDRKSVGKARQDPSGNTWRISASFAGLLPGNTEVVALARDSSGNIVASPTGFINVTAASSIAPSITITPSTVNPAFNRQVQLRSNARDSDGSVSQVQYFANATLIATSTNSSTLFLSNWTPTASGVYYLYAVATDNTGITTVSPTVEVNVRRNNPVLENSAFILQTYQDIANTTNINPLVFDQLDEQLASGALTRADIIVTPLTANGGLALTDLSGFQTPVNFLATYYVLMGQWPTPANYATFLGNARNFGLGFAVNNILTANEYFAKYGVVPTTQLLDSPTSALPAEVFLNRLHEAAGIRPPEPVDRVRFRSNNVLSATQGRGYAVVGLQQAILEFVTNTNSTNTALFAKARAAALFYQLDKPPVTMSVDDITARIDALLKLPDNIAIANAVLKDVLYGYRYVTITKQPQSLVVNPRSGAIFTVEAQGAPPLQYQWLLNGAPIPGATSPTLSLTNVDVGRVGSYKVAITSSAATDTSDVATLTLSNVLTKLANISTRGVTTGGNNVLIGGFVVSGTNQTQTRQMLIRVIGPSLAGAPFNVQGTLADPRLELYAANVATPVLTNDNWANQQGGAAQVNAIQQATARAGAFTLNQNSLDAVVLATLPPGTYTVQAKGPANNPNASGVVLIEAYDVTPNANAAGKAMNVSTRGTVGTGSNILIAGFVVNGGVSRRVLIRGVGPTLTRFGLAANTVLADPQLTLINQDTGKTVATNDDWAAGDDAGVVAAAANAAGAFALTNGSKDAAMLVMLQPGAYTVQLSGVNNGQGIAIVEVYDVDP